MRLFAEKEKASLRKAKPTDIGNNKNIASIPRPGVHGPEGDDFSNQ